ncbi:MAG: DNA-directed RNA polymerase subunit alpha C-terminal domain-containing protein [Saprospiraceae bacterium]
MNNRHIILKEEYKSLRTLQSLICEDELMNLLNLNDQSKTVMRLYWRDVLSILEISRKMNLSKERIHQIIVKSIKRIISRVRILTKAYDRYSVLEMEVARQKALIEHLYNLLIKQGPEVVIPEPGLLTTRLDSISLSVRTRNALRNSKIYTIGDLVRHTRPAIMVIKNLGARSIREIDQLLLLYGLPYAD